MSALRIPASAVGIMVGPREDEVDARWLMAYAAALGEHGPEYFDTTRPGGILAHPLFPVCYEWPLALDVRAKAVPDDVAVRGVHATHRLTLHRPPRAGDRLSTTATVVALERRTPGAYLVLRMETVDAAGQPVSTTEYGSLYLGVECESAPHPNPLPRREGEHGTFSPQGRGQGEGHTEPGAGRSTCRIATTLAHVYTGARESGTRSTPTGDRARRRAARHHPPRHRHAGLAISQALRQQPRGAATPGRAVAARFGAMVRCPSRLVVRGQAPAVAGRRGRALRGARRGRPPRGARRGARAGAMTKLERVLAALKRQPTDRPPYAFWRHFPDVDGNPAALAQSTLRFHERYQSDFLKVTPTGGYAVADWGCVESSEVLPDGHRPCARHAVNGPEDWKKIRPVKMESTSWASHLETIIRCVVDRRVDCPTIPTVFSPLSLARKLSGDRLNYDLKENPQAVSDAVEATTETILAFAEACFRGRARRASSTRSRRPAPPFTPRRSTATSASRTTGASWRRCAPSPSSPSSTATASA